jgi:hypothetical protein
MKFKVKEESDKIIVSVELPHSRRTGKIIPRQLIRTEDVLLELSNRGVEYGRVLETTTVKNWREHTRKGIWVFEKKAEKPLDKPVESVILIKKEKPFPKKTKRKSRSRKTSAKKTVKKEAVDKEV